MSKALETVPIALQETYALRALRDGKANEHQQRMALQTIVKVFARTHDQSFIPGEPDATAFMEGRRFVGNRILRHLTVPLKELHPNEKVEE